MKKIQKHVRQKTIVKIGQNMHEFITSGSNFAYLHLGMMSVPFTAVCCRWLG